MQASVTGPTKSKRIKKEPGVKLPEKTKSNVLKLVWHHFERIDVCLAVCKYCRTMLFYRTSTWYLLSHLITCHKHDLNELRGPNNDVSPVKEDTSDPLGTSHCIKISPEQREQIDRDLLEVFINDYHPFSMVEERAFKKIFKNIPGYVLPTKETIMSIMIPSLYEETVAKLRDFVVSNARSICLTVELWAAAPKEKYLVVTAHFIDKEFNRRSILLNCKGIEGERSKRDKINVDLKNITEDWSLGTKVMMVMSDYDETMEQALKSFGWQLYRCHYHTINLLFMRSIKQMVLYTRIKKIIQHFQTSSVSSGMLISYQIQNMAANGPPKPLIQDNFTYWTSIYDMWQRFVDLKHAVQACSRVIGKSWFVIDDREWTTIEQTCNVLSLFKQITSLLTKQQFTPGSLVIVVINYLVSVCDTLLLNTYYNYLQPEVRELVNDIKYTLMNMPVLEKDTNFAVCTLLDPRFKIDGFQSDTSVKDLKNDLRSLVTNVIDKRNLDFIKRDPSVDDSMTWDMLKETPAPLAVREIKQYFHDSLLPERTADGECNDPGQWWREHKSKYPLLAEVYRTKCNIVATNIRTEQHFSQTGLRSLKRNNLDMQMIEKLAFLNANLDPKRFDG